jgi:predicted DNA-binding antitoxin AbrB/MazE fold protein
LDVKMDGEIPVTYSNGVLRPDEELPLPDGSRLTVSVRPGGPTPESRQKAWDLIDRIRREKLIRLRGGRFTRDDLYDRR